MKGGVGKTTITANVFRELYRRLHKNILLIDFDPQHNLSQLILTRTQHETIQSESKTLWDAVRPDQGLDLFSVSDDDLLVPEPCAHYAIRLRQISSGHRLDL